MTYGIRMMIWAGLTFAMMNVAVKLLPGIPSAEIVFFRAMVSLVLSAYFVRRKRIPYFGNNKRVLLLRGLFGTTALMLFFLYHTSTAVGFCYGHPLFVSHIYGVNCTLFPQRAIEAKSILFFHCQFCRNYHDEGI